MSDQYPFKDENSLQWFIEQLNFAVISWSGSEVFSTVKRHNIFFLLRPVRCNYYIKQYLLVILIDGTQVNGRGSLNRLDILSRKCTFIQLSNALYEYNFMWVRQTTNLSRNRFPCLHSNNGSNLSIAVIRRSLWAVSEGQKVCTVFYPTYVFNLIDSFYFLFIILLWFIWLIPMILFSIKNCKSFFFSFLRNTFSGYVNK